MTEILKVNNNNNINNNNRIHKKEFLLKNQQPFIITEKTYPFRIKYVNYAWTQLCGYSLSEVYNESVFILKYKDIIKKDKQIISINIKKGNKKFLHMFNIIECEKYNVGITIFSSNIK